MRKLAGIVLISGLIAGCAADKVGDSKPEATPAPTEVSAPPSVAETAAATTPETDPPTTEKVATTDSSPPDTVSTPRDGEVANAPQGSIGTHDSPVPAGEIADIGSGWRLQVLDVVADATDLVTKENDFNDPPPAGSTFTLVKVALGYFGLDDPQSAFSPSISAVGAKSVELDNNCGVVPDEIDLFTDVFTGGVITGNVCFVTTPDDPASLQLYGAGSFFDDDDVFLDASTTPTGATAMATISGPQADAASSPARLAPTPIGTTADLGDGWTFGVTGPATDVTDAIEAESEFNDPPPAGYRFVAVPVAYTFNGSESASASNVTIHGIGDSNVQADSQCSLAETDVDLFSDIFPGGSVSGTLCFVVAESDMSSLVLYGTASFEIDNVMFATA